MQENNLKGLCIPYEILTNEKLSDKEKYLTRLTHREVSIGKDGKDFFNEIGINIKIHCRNPNKIESY